MGVPFCFASSQHVNLRFYLLFNSALDQYAKKEFRNFAFVVGPVKHF